MFLLPAKRVTSIGIRRSSWSFLCCSLLLSIPSPTFFFPHTRIRFFGSRSRVRSCQRLSALRFGGKGISCVLYAGGKTVTPERDETVSLRLVPPEGSPMFCQEGKLCDERARVASLGGFPVVVVVSPLSLFFFNVSSLGGWPLLALLRFFFFFFSRFPPSSFPALPFFFGSNASACARLFFSSHHTHAKAKLLTERASLISPSFGVFSLSLYLSLSLTFTDGRCSSESLPLSAPVCECVCVCVCSVGSTASFVLRLLFLFFTILLL